MKKSLTIIMLMSFAVPVLAAPAAPDQKLAAEEISLNKVVDQFVAEGKDISLMKEQLVANQKALQALSDKIEVLMPTGTVPNK